MYTIRPTAAADVPFVHALSGTWAEEAITHGVIPAPEAYLTDQLGPWFWVAETDGVVVGYIFGQVHTSDGLAVIPAGEQYLEIEDLYVHPDHRSGGLGRDLGRRLLDEAAAAGVTRSLVSSATKDWRRITTFYESLGFQMWTVQMFR